MKILNLGSLNIDRVYSVGHFVQEGETIAADKMDVYCGGKGLNQSLALARSGADVFHAGAIGPDGDILKAVLDESGANTDYIRRTAAPSGHAVIQVTPSGQNCIIVSAGANGTISEDMIDGVIGHFSPGDWLLLQNETSNAGYAILAAKKAGMRVAFNPSPVNASLLRFPLELVDLFILNETEAVFLTEAGPDKLCAADDIPVKLGAKYPSAVFVLTLGEKGSVCIKDGEKIVQGIYHVPVLDTTAAGDTFCGYFLTLYTSGADAGRALKTAAAASAIAVSRKGAGPSIPLMSEVEAFLNQSRNDEAK